MTGGRTGRAVTFAGTALALGALVLTVDNLRRLRVPPPPVEEAGTDDRVTVLLPLRDEADRVAPCLRAVLRCADAWSGPHQVEVVVLDDDSTDGTADVVRRVVRADPRVAVVDGVPRPHGWLGKPWACRQLADAAHADTTVLVFLDADVVLEPDGLRGAVALLRAAGLDLVCPYPRQLAVTTAERLVQPLLQWSWLSTLPLGPAETSPRESLVAANGQLLVVDAGAYRRAGGHAAVRAEVLDDIALLRAVKRSGGRGVVADGTHVATCRMYDGWRSLHAGYTKSLWSAFRSPAGAVAAVGLLWLAYVVPALAAVAGSRVGALGYAAGVAGRALAARRTASRVWPDSLAHPASVVVLGLLTVDSWRLRRAGRLRWKGRSVLAGRRPDGRTS